MSNREATFISLLLVVASFIIGIYFYPQLPATVAAHWSATGVANGFMGRFWGVFLLPIVSLVLFVIFAIIPSIDPQHENFAKFSHHFHLFVLFMMGFFLYLEALLLYYNVGAPFNIVRFLMPAFAALFWAVGALLSHARRNWFVGIRTPWTLESDRVWNKTHALASRLFKTCALLALLGIVFPTSGFWYVIVPVVVTVLWTVIYSYTEYQKEQQG